MSAPLTIVHVVPSPHPEDPDFEEERHRLRPEWYCRALEEAGFAKASFFVADLLDAPDTDVWVDRQLYPDPDLHDPEAPNLVGTQAIATQWGVEHQVQYDSPVHAFMYGIAKPFLQLICDYVAAELDRRRGGVS